MRGTTYGTCDVIARALKICQMQVGCLITYGYVPEMGSNKGPDTDIVPASLH
jgi:hypothetical protein